MTTANFEIDEDAVEGQPHRIVLLTIAVLLPASLNDADIADIVPASIAVTGHEDCTLTDLFHVKVQDARLVMT